MNSRFAVSCGQAAHPSRSSEWERIHLDLSAAHGNVHLKTKDITRRLISDIEPIWADLAEIATYVYVADQAAKRDNSADLLGSTWKREFSFAVPVRCPDVWSDHTVYAPLVELLNFMSGDSYAFKFEALKEKAPFQMSLLTDRELGHQDIDEVVLFSGGLDSLAGAVNVGGVRGKNLLLVSHRSSSKISTKQGNLARRLSERFGDRRFFHVPIWINKDKRLSEEYTQRTRTFLFSALAGIIAVLLGRYCIHFFENGVTSLNLPITGQLVGTRASRSTHPRTLFGVGALLTALAGKSFKVKNELFWRTKTDVVDLIGDSECADLVSQSVSCHHTWEMSNLHTHCGKCSQCVGRRIATLASKYAIHDPSEMYKVDLWTGEREQGKDLTLMESTVLQAREIRHSDAVEFCSRNGEVISALQYLDGDRARNLRRIYDLHRRHAEDVNRVLNLGFAKYSEEIRERGLHPTCMLSISMAALPDHSQPRERPASEQPATDPPQFPNLPGLSATEDFRTVWTTTSEFVLTSTQAACVGYMVEQSRNGPAAIGQSAILEGADSRCKTLKSLFKRSAAWKHLIVPGGRKGTYRLNVPV